MLWLKILSGDTTATKNRIQLDWTTGFLEYTWGMWVTEVLRKMSQVHKPCIIVILLPGTATLFCVKEWLIVSKELLWIIVITGLYGKNGKYGSYETAGAGRENPEICLSKNRTTRCIRGQVLRDSPETYGTTQSILMAGRWEQGDCKAFWARLKMAWPSRSRAWHWREYPHRNRALPALLLTPEPSHDTLFLCKKIICTANGSVYHVFNKRAITKPVGVL